jgi:hypothetical protein
LRNDTIASAVSCGRYCPRRSIRSTTNCSENFAMHRIWISVVSLVVGTAWAGAAAAVELRQAAAEIDAILEAHWKQVGVEANAPIGDDVFVRRIYLDFAGRIPTYAETRAFMADGAPHKRESLIADLLTRDSYVAHFYHFWADVLRVKSSFVNTANVVPIEYARFIKDSLRTNKPYDVFVREMLGAKSYAWDDGAIGYYLRDPDMPLDNMSLTTRIFLGTRIECAQCHDHPFDKWKQTEFYHLAAYTYANRPMNEAFAASREAIRERQLAIEREFQQEKAASKDGGKAAEQRKQQRFEAMDYRKVVGIIKSPVGQLFSPIGLERKPNAVLKLPFDFQQADGQPGDVMTPAPIFGTAPALSPGDDPVEVFARWVASPENPTFTKVIVNRLWKKMFGVALIEPIDDLHDDTAAMVPELQTYLERLMISLKYDMRAFLAVIANTKAYQSAVVREEFARGDTFHFQGPALRRMTAEQIWDSLVALGSYEPDARDLEREARDARKVAVSQMACDAYLNFDGEKLVEMAYARLAAEKEWDVRDKAVKEALIVAKRAGDKEAELQLRRQEGALRREHGEAMVREFLMPVIENLAKLKAGPDAQPIVDELYKMNSNPAVLSTETWKKMYIPGYGPAPKTAAAIATQSEVEERRLRELAVELGFKSDEQASFVAYCKRAAMEWKRAAELDSPAPRGHFLRTMGQSDRDFVENANLQASIPQALVLMNSELISKKGLLSPYSPLMRGVAKADDPVEAAYLTLLARRPTEQERRSWATAFPQGEVEDLIYVLLNTKQFLFIQ